MKVGDLIRFKARTYESSFFHVLEVLKDGVNVIVIGGKGFGEKHFIPFSDREIEVISEET